MNKSFISFIVVVLALCILVLPTIQAADIELSDTCTLADAITAANTDEAVGGCPAGDGADTISLASDITLDAALPQITTGITIEGGGYTISGNNRLRIFVVNGGNLTIHELTLTNGFGDWGGAIANLKGMLKISSSTIANCSAVEGGAIGNEGTLNVIDSVFQDNVSEERNGGAINQAKGRLSISHSVFNNNTSSHIGGAVFIGGGEKVNSIIYSTFNRNFASIGGAIGINSANSLLDIIKSTFSSNSASGGGGAVYFDGEKGQMRISESAFSQNSSDAGIGGALFLTDSLMLAASPDHLKLNTNISDSGFSRNSAKDGGAVYSRFVDLKVVNTAFIGNDSGADGGAIFSWGNTSISSSTISQSKSGANGGGLNVAAGRVSLENVTLVSNEADRGGGLYRDTDSEVNLLNSIIANNRGGDCFGRLSENIGNLIADGSCFATLSGDPMLGELIEPEDGSPAYYPLLEGSPAIDAADDEYCPDTDIIGTARPQGLACDIGAYELPQ